MGVPLRPCNIISVRTIVSPPYRTMYPIKYISSNSAHRGRLPGCVLSDAAYPIDMCPSVGWLSLPPCRPTPTLRAGCYGGALYHVPAGCAIRTQAKGLTQVASLLVCEDSGLRPSISTPWRIVDGDSRLHSWTPGKVRAIYQYTNRAASEGVIWGGR